MGKRKTKASRRQRAAVAAVCAVLALAALGGLYRCVSREPSLPGAEEDAEGGQVPVQTGGDALLADEERKEHFYTVLISCLDDGNGGSDTNLLAALDAGSGTLAVLSLPRDTLLDVSWTVKKLNSAWNQGGSSRLREEVSRLLGVPVDYSVTVDFSGFAAMVDALGGVEFDVPVDMDYDDPEQDLHIHLPAGTRLLTGEEALEVVRWRQNNDGTGYAAADIGRIATQQAFLSAAVREALLPENLDRLPELASLAFDAVDTDLKLSNLIWIAEQVAAMGEENIAFYTLPGDGSGYYKGVSYYVLDPEAVLELVNAHFDPYVRELTPEDLDILAP